ncbi:histidine kinase [Nostoc sp. DSM 114161]|jgi:PAS domain S-box-containing protein|uniref:PAS domain-containing protein n=1 Tax=Nostoc sp. DSM 114161 TaxID=3440143 RepID=UPI00404550D2
MVQPLTVLIIDDSPEDRQVYRRYLLQDQEHSYTILEAELGEEALALYQQFQPEGILLDFMLPDMDGLEFLAELQQQSKATMPAVIMLTGYGNESVAVQAMKSGVQDYLIKGQTTAERLRSTIYSAIKNTQLRQQLQCSEERFRTSVENMLDCFGICSAIRNDTGEILDFCVDYVNAAACEFTQIDKEEQLGKGLCEVLPYFRASDLFDDCCQVVETGNPLAKESLIYTSNFHRNQLLTKTIDIRITKMGDGFVASWRDVTDKYQAQQRLRSSQQFIERIAETTPGILYVYDLVKQQSVYVNSQVSKLLGYTPEQIQQMGTQFLPTLMHPEDLARFASVFQELGSTEDNNIVENEYRMRHANGEWRWFCSRDTIFTTNADGSPHQIIGTTFDITERKQTEEQLRLSNERFQLAAAAVNCLIYDWDVENDRIERTEGLTKILGYSLKEVPTTHQWWKEQIHPEDRERLMAQFHSIISTNQNHYSVEYRARHKDREYRYVLDRGVITRDANGRVIRAVGSTTDISDAYQQATQRKRAEVALQESEAKFRRIVESNIVGIYFGDFNGVVYEANDAFLETFGYTREDLAAGIINWGSMTPPEYQTLDLQKIQELQVSGVCTPFEKEYLHKNGTPIPVLLGIARIESTKDNGYSVCFVLDLTQRKRTEIALRQSEESYRYLSNAMPQLVWICNHRGECEHVNDRWYEFTGQRVEDAMGFGWKKVIHPDDIDAAMEAWTQALQTGELYQQEIRYQKRDGSCSWHLVRGVPIKNEQGSIIKWFGTSTDIDDRKHLEAERNQLLQLEQAARAQAEAANRAKDEFVAIVSHDLRSPLHAILGWVQLLRTRKFDEANLVKALETIERNARSQEKLLEDLLNISRILQGKLQLEVSQVNLGVIVGAAIETAYPSANAKNIRLESIIDRSIPTISGDINRLLQILANLLANAIKFTPSGGQVEISLFRNDSHAEITVRDTGIGISPEFLPYVFERYHQGHSTHKQGGLGLGLAIARHLVELHGGSIQVSSPGIGQGATFSIKLPL